MTAILVPPYAAGRLVDGPYPSPFPTGETNVVGAAVWRVPAAEGVAGMLAAAVSPLATVATALLLAGAVAAAAGDRAGAAAGLLYVSTTIAGPNAKFLQAETVAAAALAAVWAPVLARRRDGRAEALALLGAAAATAIRYEASLFVAAAALHRGLALGAERSVAPLAGVAVGIATNLLANWTRFGAPWETGFGAEAFAFTHTWWLGLLGIVVSPGKGIFALSPLLLLLPGALVRLRRPEVLLAGAILVPYAILGAWWHYEIGMWGMRFQFYAVPVLLALVCLAYPRLPPLGVALAALGAVVQALGLAVDPSGYFHFAQPWWVRPWYLPRHPLVWQVGAALAGGIDRGHLLVVHAPVAYSLFMAMVWAIGISAAARLRAAISAASRTSP